MNMKAAIQGKIWKSPNFSVIVRLFESIRETNITVKGTNLFIRQNIYNTKG